MTVVAASGIGTDTFHAVVFDPDTDRCLARVTEHTTGEYVDLRVGTQHLTIAPGEVAGAITVLGWYAHHLKLRLDEDAERALANANAEVGDQR